MATNSNNNLPNPSSYEQILSDMLSAYAAKVGINDFNVGSAVLSFFEVVALSTARASGDLFQILRDFSVDRATGDALQRLATENGVTPITAAPATGNINILDTSFVKISTQIYAGTPPPNIGSTTIYVSDASQFPSAGAVYIGRGTPNIEGPISYSTAPTIVGGYWQIVLNTPTTKFHNLSESVILSQGGNRSIPAGTVVVAPAVGANPDIQYSITVAAVILDGETQVDNILVTALLPGSSGNVPIGAISEFASPPFSGAAVTNPLSFTTGVDNQTDQQLRVAIKLALASTGLGTSTAILNAIIGATSANAQSSITSAQIVLQTNGSAIVYIDNGMGYEALSQGVGLEYIVTDAIGGQQYFQLATGGSQAPVAKAFIQSTLPEPYNLVTGDTLAINVGGVVYQHVFEDSDFVNPGGATAYEVTASINSDTTLGFAATTAGGGTYVVLSAISETNDSIQVATPTTDGGNAATIMGFPTSLSETLRLYKNNIPLSKDGQTADVFSQQQSLWSNTITNGDTLILQVDNTSPITYTILNTDFINTGLYTSVSAANSLASWQEVFQNKLTGVTTSISGQQLELTSNLGANDRAQISIDPTSTLVTKGMFSTLIGLSSVGKSSDFTLDRNTAQFELAVPLIAGDTLSAGSTDTQATLEGGAITGSSITFPVESYFWILADAPGQLINTGVSSNTVLVVTATAPNLITYTSSVSSAFDAVLPGDYVIIWSTELNVANRIEGRVHSVTSTVLNIAVTAAEYSAIVPQTITFLEGFVVLRSNSVPRKFSLPSGTSTLNQIATELQAQTDQINFSVQLEESLIISTATTDSSGSLLFVTADEGAQLLDFVVGSSSGSQPSLSAFEDSSYSNGQLPLFFHNTFSADSLAYPPDSNVTSATSSVALINTDPNNLIGFLNPYGGINDEQPSGEFDQMASLDSTAEIIGLVPQNLVRRIRGGIDRFFLASPLDFGNNDTMTVITDNDPTTNTFSIPFYRTATTNTTYPSNSVSFNAYDTIAGATASFGNPLTFGAFPDIFGNYKVLMQAKKVLNTSVANTAILYRANQWGRSGQYIQVGYTYPSVPSTSISSTVVVGETTTINIILPSGAPIITGITSTTQWNTTVTSNTPVAGIDQVTYTWNGIGTNPTLSLSGGEYVNITNQTGFGSGNIGVFKVSTAAGYTPGSTYFSVQVATGTVSPQSNISTGVNGAISFYASTPNVTANQVIAYVNANLVDITATLATFGVSNNGSGSIIYSTAEDNDFSFSSVQLKDGINWIYSSNTVSNPQFTLKEPLSLYTDYGYDFRNGEVIKIIPTTIDQVYQFLSVLAVTGFTTLGTLAVVDRGSKLEMATITLGSNGAIQIIGGYANDYSIPVLNAGSRIDNEIMSITASSVASAGVLSDQWFRLQASTAQAKDALFGSNTNVTITGNSPTTGQSLIQLSNRTLTQRNFGIPRNYVRTQGDTFRIEQQGSLVCMSWTGIGSNTTPFSSVLNFNDSGGGTYNASLVSGSDDVQFTILTGNANFTELSIGDLITVNLSNTVNNGTFLVTGVSEDGTVVEVLNPDAQNVFSSVPFVFSGNANSGDTFTIGATTLTAGQYAFVTITSPEVSTPVTVTANNLGTAGNTVALQFDGSTITINSAIITWNTANPTNTVSVTSGNGSQIPAGTAFASFTGTIAGTSTSVTITANVAGTMGNNVNLSFNGAISINTAISNWNIANPSNTVSLTAGDGTQTPTVGASAPFTGGVGYTADLSGGTNGTFALGANQADTEANLSAAINLIAGVTSSVSGNDVIVYGTVVGQTTTISTTSSNVTPHSPTPMVGSNFTSGQFSASSAVSEGDTVMVKSPFNILNQGQFRVIRQLEDSIWFENPDVIEEEVSLPFNGINLGFDGTTSFEISSFNNHAFLTWNTGTGTEPHLGNAEMGDIITFGTDFPSAFQGSFMVVDSSVKLQEITQVTAPAGSVFVASGVGTYWTLYSAGNAGKYYVWFYVNGATTDPAPGGYTGGIQVTISTSNNPIAVASAISTAINGFAGAFIATTNGNIVTVTTVGYEQTNASVNFNVPLPFAVEEFQVGTATFLEVINPAADGQSPSSVLITNVLTDHRPQLQFSEYEATVPGDSFVVAGNVLGNTNMGSYPIVQVINRNTAIVSGSMTSTFDASLTGASTSVFIQEGIPYYGYKQVKLVNSLPGTSGYNIITFTTNAQYEKIDQSASVELVALNKLNFGTSLINGLDSYKYNTDLIQIANKIIYGDPTDTTTYPGVGAAGADIFVQAPLVLRITMSIDIRLQTGVPFATTAQQVQSNVASLVNSNPVGQSIALSSVVSAAASVPGVVSVVITSPLYDASSDLIVVEPSEKTLIIDPGVDISVAQIGT